MHPSPVTKGFVLGAGIGLFISWFAFAALHKFTFGQYMNDLDTLVEQSASQDLPINLRLVELAENGNTDEIIDYFCWRINNQIQFIDFSSIEDETVRARINNNLEDGRRLVARLESEGRCQPEKKCVHLGSKEPDHDNKCP